MKKKQYKNKLQISDSLFFKVFRNLVIRNKILGFIKCGFKINSYEYQSIISTEFMIKNGLFQLLYEKVTLSEYLIFNNDIDGPNYCDDGTSLFNTYKEELKGRIILKKEYSIFNCFNDGNNYSKGYQFYKSLFKNYSKQFPSKDQLYTIGIEYDNIAILRVLEDGYFITPKSVKQLIRSINIGSFKTAELILNHFISTISSTSNNFEIFIGDLFKETIGSFQKQLESDNKIRLFNNKVDFLFKHKELKLKYQRENVELVLKSISASIGLFKMFIYQKPLQLVIQCCRTLIYLNLDSYIYKFVNGLSRSGNFKMVFQIEQDLKQFKFQSIETFEKMISNCNFTNKEMETKICDLGDRNLINKDKLDAIIRCFRMLIVFTNDKYELYSNWMFYQFKYFNSNYFDVEHVKIKMPELDIIRFGIYKSIVGVEYQQLSKQQIEHTFSYCKYNWNIQKSFFINAIKEIKSGISNSNLIDDLIKIACGSCSSFPIELLDLVKKELNIKLFSIKQLKSFKSIPLIDYILNHNNQNFSSCAKANHFSDLLQLNLFNYQIANHLKSNYKLEFENEIVTIDIDPVLHNLDENKCNLDLTFIQENWNDNFQVHFPFNGSLILSKFNNCNEFEQFIKKNLSSIKLATRNKPINLYGQNKQSSIYQTNYMYNLKSQLFLNNTFIRPSDSISFLTRYLRNEFFDLFNSNNKNMYQVQNPFVLSNSIYMVLNEISKRGDIQTLELLLSDKFKEFKKYIIKYVIFKCSKYGQLSILKYFKSNEKYLNMELNFSKVYSSNTTTTDSVLNINNNGKEMKRQSKKKNQNYHDEEEDEYSTLFKRINEITMIDDDYQTIYKKSFKSLQCPNKQFIESNFTIDDWHFIFAKYLFPNGYFKLIKFITSKFQYKINLDWLNTLIDKEKDIISINNYLILHKILHSDSQRIKQ